MIPENKISKFITLLIEETIKGDLKWTVTKPRAIDSREGEQKLIGSVYLSTFKDKDLRLYKYSEPYHIGEFEYQDKTFYKLEFVDSDNRNLWAIPYYIREQYDLYETVQIKASNIDQFIDEIIPDNDNWDL